MCFRGNLAAIISNIIESSEPSPKAAMHTTIRRPPPRFTGERMRCAVSLFLCICLCKADESLAWCFCVCGVFGVFLDASYSKRETGAWPHFFQFYFKFTSFICWLTSGVSSDCTYGSCLVFKICNMIDWLANEFSIFDFFLKKNNNNNNKLVFPSKAIPEIFPLVKRIKRQTKTFAYCLVCIIVAKWNICGK